jgi:hypothetical protein
VNARTESREKEKIGEQGAGEQENGIMGQRDNGRKGQCRESGTTTNESACGSGKAFGVVDRPCCSLGGRCVATHLWLLGSHFGSKPQGGGRRIQMPRWPLAGLCLHKTQISLREATRV